MSYPSVPKGRKSIKASRTLRNGLMGVATVLLTLAAVTRAAQPPVKFSRDILPMFQKDCSPCHSGSAAPGGYTLETAAKLLAGGRHGAAVVPGKSGEGSLVKYLTGEIKPQMPPGKPYTLDQIALIKRWIDEGAKIDSMTVTTEEKAKETKGGSKTLPVKPKVTQARPVNPTVPLPAPVEQAAPVTALAFSPDGKLLAVAGYKTVWLYDSAARKEVHALSGPSDQVLALTWSSDGKRLAAAGGVAGSFGEVVIWNADRWDEPRVIREHADTIYGIAWKPDSSEFSTASLDKTVKIWDGEAGKAVRTLKDHADAVYSVAYSRDGKWMATGSADRSSKLYLTENYNRPVTLMTHRDAVLAVAFSANGEILATTCADKEVRAWPVKAEPMENPLRGHGEPEPINAIAFSADGSVFVSGASSRKFRVRKGDVSDQKQETEASDWIYSVAVSPDGKLFAGGTADGKLYFWTGDHVDRPLGDNPLATLVPVGSGK